MVTVSVRGELSKWFLKKIPSFDKGQVVLVIFKEDIPLPAF